MNNYPKALFLLLAVALMSFAFMAQATNSPSGNPAGGDFPAFYVAGTNVLDQRDVSALYDAETQRSDQLELVGSDANFLPFAYPPQVAIIYAPFAALPYRLAYATNVLIMLIALAAAFQLMKPMVPVLRKRYWAAVFLAAVFVPITFSIGIGQNATVTLLLLAWIWRSLHDGNEISAGIAVALMMFKPQFGIPMLGLLFVGRYFRAVGGAGIGIAVTAILNTAVFGFDWVTVWATHAGQFAALDFDRGPDLVSVSGQAQSIFGTSAAIVIGGLATAAISIALVLIWRQPNVPVSLTMAVTAPGLILINPHSVFYETALVVITIAALIEIKAIPKWSVFVLVITGAGRTLSSQLGFSVLGPVVIYLFLAALYVAAKSHPQPARSHRPRTPAAGRRPAR